MGNAPFWAAVRLISANPRALAGLAQLKENSTIPESQEREGPPPFPHCPLKVSKDGHERLEYPSDTEENAIGH